MSLPMLPQGKAMHVIYGGVAFLIGFLIAHFALPRIGLHVMRPHHAGLACSFAAGVAKEAWDWWRNRQAAAAGLPPPDEVSLSDVLITTAGGLVGWLPFALGGAL